MLDDLGDRLHIVYLGRDAIRARQLGYWEIDREVFEVVVARDDVAGLAEERVEFPLAAATFPPSSPAPPAGAGTLSGAIRCRACSPRPMRPRPRSTEPEPDTLIQGRLDAQGRLRRARRTEPPGPRPRMEPAGGRPWLRLGGPAPADHGPRTTDRAAAWHGSPAPEPWSGPWPAPEPRPEPWTDSFPRPRRIPRRRRGGSAAGTAHRTQGPGLASAGFCRTTAPGRHSADRLRGR